MKLALVGPYPVDTARIPGGVAAVTYYLTQGLARFPDIEVHVIAATKQVQRDETVRSGNITVHYLSYPKARLVPNQLRDIARIKRVLSELRPDLVHSQTPSGADAGYQTRLPTVLTIHGIPTQERRFARGIGNRLGATLAPWLTRRALLRADAGIAISPYVVEHYRSLSSVRWHNIANPIQDEFFVDGGSEHPAKLLYAGVMYARKNIPGLIRAFHLVHQAHAAAELFICGKVLEPQIFEWARRYVADNGLGDRVHLLGFVDQEELARHFTEAAVICLFSEEETAPMIIAQAMCAAKPVVSTAAGGVPHMVVHDRTGYIVPIGDERGFADCTLRLLRDESLRRNLGAEARRIAEARYRTEAIVRQTIDVYESVLSSHGR